jgi:hypothetical protein
MPYGVWGVGRLTGAPEFDPGDGRLRVPLDLRVFEPARRVPRTDLRADDRLADLEVFRQPQAANPSFLTVAQFAALGEYLPVDPGHGPTAGTTTGAPSPGAARTSASMP